MKYGKLTSKSKIKIVIYFTSVFLVWLFGLDLIKSYILVKVGYSEGSVVAYSDLIFSIFYILLIANKGHLIEAKLCLKYKE